MKLEDICPHCAAPVAEAFHSGTGAVFQFRCGHATRVIGAAIITLNRCPEAPEFVYDARVEQWPDEVEAAS